MAKKEKNYLKDENLVLAVKEYIKSHYSHYKKMRREFDSNLKKWEEQYLSIYGDKYYEGVANIFVPATFNAVETLMPRIVQGLVGRREFFKIESGKGKIAKDLQAFMLGQFERSNFKGELIPFIRQACIKGTTVAKVYWDTLKEYMPSGSKKLPQSQVLYDGPIFKTTNLQNIYVDLTISDIQKQPIVIESIWANYAKVKRNEKHIEKVGDQELEVGIYEGVDKIQTRGFEEERMTAGEKEIYQARGLKPEESPKEYTKEADRKLFKPIHLLECWFQYDLNGDGYLESCVATLANDNVLIRLEENPFSHKKYPYIKTVLVPVSGQFYGKGVPEIAGNLQIELNDTRNQLMDFKTFVLDNMWVVSETADIDDDQLIARAHGIIRSKDDGHPDLGIRALRPNMDILRTGVQIEALIQQNIRTATMATETLQGMPIKGETTATEVSKVLQESMSRLLLVMRSIEFDALVPFYRMCYQLNLQFMKSMDTPTGGTQDVLPDARFVALGSLGVESEMVKVQQMVNLLNISPKLGGSPAQNEAGEVVGLKRLSPLKIAEKIYETWGYHDFDDMVEVVPFPSLPELPPGKAGTQPQNAPKPKNESDVLRATGRSSGVK